jgi:16S rRNA (guanine527-N7)-methyltransferase
LVENHILDSLSPFELLQNKMNIVDVGSGGGFPAIPLGIICPYLNIVMVESREKKVIFLKEAIKSLGLSNLNVYRGRIEEYKPENLFDYATVRAVTLTVKIKNAIFNLLKPSGGIIYYEKRGKCQVIKP